MNLRTQLDVLITKQHALTQPMLRALKNNNRQLLDELGDWASDLSCQIKELTAQLLSNLEAEMRKPGRCYEECVSLEDATKIHALRTRNQ